MPMECPHGSHHRLQFIFVNPSFRCGRLAKCWVCVHIGSTICCISSLGTLAAVGQRPHTSVLQPIIGPQGPQPIDVQLFVGSQIMLGTLDLGNCEFQAVLETLDLGSIASQAILWILDFRNIGYHAILGPLDRGSIGSQAILGTLGLRSGASRPCSGI